MSSWLVVVMLAGCGSGIDKKGPEVADNNANNRNNENNANNANNTVGPTNNVNNTIGPTNNANNTIGPTNNTIGPTNNANNTNNTNNGDTWTCYTDADGDGWGTDEQVIDSFCEDVGLVLDGGDCDDDDRDVFPGAAETCEAIDRDCDGVQVSVPDVCATIQQALDVMSFGGGSGDIVVAAGTYQESITFNQASVRLIGAGPATTTIDGSGNFFPTVRFVADEGPDSIIEGFTITGGRGELTSQGRRGGGIYINEASPTLRNLVVRDNTSGGDSGYGGGISMLRSESLVERVDVIGNVAGYYGGGLYVALSDAEFRQLRVIGNDALYGGGIALYYSDALVVASAVLANKGTFGGGGLVQGNAPRLENVTWAGNLAEDEGGALSLFSDTTVALVNNTFSGNNAPAGGAIFVDAGTPAVRFSNFFDNGASALVGLSLNQTVASTQSPPNFVSTSGDATTWDVHLAVGSALIDAGDPAIDDFDGTRSDIGAHGGPAGDW